MSNSNQSSRMEVPQAKESMDKFKMEVANDRTGRLCRW